MVHDGNGPPGPGRMTNVEQRSRGMNEQLLGGQGHARPPPMLVCLHRYGMSCDLHAYDMTPDTHCAHVTAFVMSNLKPEPTPTLLN